MNQTSVDAVREHRKQFPALANKSYFNFGGQGTLPRSSIDAVVTTYEYLQETGPFSTAIFTWLNTQQDLTRGCLAREFGGAASSYALTQNATEGCNIAMWGLDWEQGDHLVMTDSEHVGVIHAAQQLQRRRKLELTSANLSAARNNADMVELVVRELKPQTRLVVLSHVLWNTGQTVPLTEIVDACHLAGVPVLVDGAQSAGAINLDLNGKDNADFYAMTGHKWCCGPEGVGTLFVDPAALDILQPTFVGWRGSTMDYSTGQPTGFNPGASRYEVGTGAIPLFAGLRNSLDVHNKFADSKSRAQMVLANANKVIKRLSQISQVECLLQEAESGLVSFKVHGVTHRDVAMRLDSEFSVFVRTIPTPDCIRASIHYFTTDDEIERLASSIETILKH